jgi:hypothetical protein
MSFCVVATIKTYEFASNTSFTAFGCCNNIKRNYTKPEVKKITATFAPVDLLTFD